MRVANLPELLPRKQSKPAAPPPAKPAAPPAKAAQVRLSSAS
jgi:hypothetical protein